MVSVCVYMLKKCNSQDVLHTLPNFDDGLQFLIKLVIVALFQCQGVNNNAYHSRNW
jgi:hypothetical protein